MAESALARVSERLGGAHLLIHLQQVTIKLAIPVTTPSDFLIHYYGTILTKEGYKVCIPGFNCNQHKYND